MHVPKTSRRSHAPGFTLIELLVVIGIIGVLVGISFAIGRSVTGNAKKQMTEGLLRSLDESLQAYMDATDGQPPKIVAEPLIAPATTPVRYWPLIDGRDMEHLAPAGFVPPGNQIINTLGLFMLEAQKTPAAKAVLDKMPSKQVARIDPDGAAPNGQPELFAVLDAWGRPIRFVHPSMDGIVLSDNAASPTGGVSPGELQLQRPPSSATVTTAWAVNSIRRNHQDLRTPGTPVNAQDFADSDGGTCVGNRGYFYSMGEDGHAGWYRVGADYVDGTKDNVYSSPPTPRGKPTQ